MASKQKKRNQELENKKNKQKKKHKIKNKRNKNLKKKKKKRLNNNDDNNNNNNNDLIENEYTNHKKGSAGVVPGFLLAPKEKQAIEEKANRKERESMSESNDYDSNGPGLESYSHSDEYFDERDFDAEDENYFNFDPMENVGANGFGPMGIMGGVGINYGNPFPSGIGYFEHETKNWQQAQKHDEIAAFIKKLNDRIGKNGNGFENELGCRELSCPFTSIPFDTDHVLVGCTNGDCLRFHAIKHGPSTKPNLLMCWDRALNDYRAKYDDDEDDDDDISKLNQFNHNMKCFCNVVKKYDKERKQQQKNFMKCNGNLSYIYLIRGGKVVKELLSKRENSETHSNVDMSTFSKKEKGVDTDTSLNEHNDSNNETGNDKYKENNAEMETFEEQENKQEIKEEKEKEKNAMTETEPTKMASEIDVDDNNKEKTIDNIKLIVSAEQSKEVDVAQNSGDDEERHEDNVDLNDDAIETESNVEPKRVISNEETSDKCDSDDIKNSASKPNSDVSDIKFDFSSIWEDSNEELVDFDRLADEISTIAPSISGDSVAAQSDISYQSNGSQMSKMSEMSQISQISAKTSSTNSSQASTMSNEWLSKDMIVNKYINCIINGSNKFWQIPTYHAISRYVCCYIEKCKYTKHYIKNMLHTVTQKYSWIKHKKIFEYTRNNNYRVIKSIDDCMVKGGYIFKLPEDTYSSEVTKRFKASIELKHFLAMYDHNYEWELKKITKDDTNPNRRGEAIISYVFDWFGNEFWKHNANKIRKQRKKSGFVRPTTPQGPFNIVNPDPNEQVTYEQFKLYYTQALEEGGHGEFLPVMFDDINDINMPGAVGFDENEDVLSIVSGSDGLPSQGERHHREKKEKMKKKKKKTKKSKEREKKGDQNSICIGEGKFEFKAGDIVKVLHEGSEKDESEKYFVVREVTDSHRIECIASGEKFQIEYFDESQLCLKSRLSDNKDDALNFKLVKEYELNSEQLRVALDAIRYRVVFQGEKHENSPTRHPGWEYKMTLHLQ